MTSRRIPAWRRHVTACLQQLRAQDPDAPAVIDAHGTLSRAGLIEQARRAAPAIAAAGPPSVLHVVVSRSDHSFFVEIVGTWMAGRVPLPVRLPDATPVAGSATAPSAVALTAADRAAQAVLPEGCLPWKATLSASTGTTRLLVTHGESPAAPRKALALGMRPGGRAMLASPLHLNGPLEFALRQLLIGGTVVVCPGFTPDAWLEMTARHAATWAFLVPTQIERVLDRASAPEFRRATSTLRQLVHSSGPCPAQVRRRITQLLGPDVVTEYYGTAEYDGALTRAGDHGATPIPGAQLRIVDAAGSPVAPGAVGAIQGRSRTGLACHAITEPCPPARAWTGVGDTGYLDLAGRLHLVSVAVANRAIVGGIKVAIGDVQAALDTHPALTASQVRTSPNPKHGGDVIAARVECTDPTVTTEHVREHCRRLLGSAAAPRDIELVPAPPTAAPTSEHDPTTTGSAARPGTRRTSPERARPTCELCASIDETVGDCDLQRHLRPGQTRVLAATADTAAIPTIGAFHPGYLLVVPRQHCVSLGQLPVQALQDLAEVTSDLAERLRRTYQRPVLAFEYGLNVPGARRIEHAHLHLLPTTAAVALRLWLGRRLPSEQIDGFANLPRQVDQSYIAIWDSVTAKHTVHPVANDATPRIRLREVLARLDPDVDASGWDWITAPHTGNIRRTLDDLTAHEGQPPGSGPTPAPAATPRSDRGPAPVPQGVTS